MNRRSHGSSADGEPPSQWATLYQAHPLLAALSQEELSKWQQFGDFLRRPPEKNLMKAHGMVSMLLEGAVRVFIRSRDRKGEFGEALLKILRSPSLFGEAEALSEPDAPSVASVMSLSDVCILRIPNEVFVESLRSNSEFGYRLVVDVSERLRLATVNEARLVSDPLYPRLVRLLMDYTALFSENSDKTSWLNLNQERLASDLGTSRKPIAEGFAKLRSHGLLEQHGHAYRLTDLSQAAEQTQGVHSFLHVMRKM